MWIRLVAITLVLTALQVLAQPPAASWKLTYFYDKDRSSLIVADATFVSPTQAILVGALEEKDKRRPVVGLSSDSGKTWLFEPLKELPVSLFFLNATTGWMATEKSIHGTTDGGRTWKKLSPVGRINQLHFMDEKRGFAVGAPKAAFTTLDGGLTWEPIAEAQTPKSNPDNTSYDVLEFADSKYGLVFGSSFPARRQAVPEWMDPQRAASTRQVPTLTILLTTQDGGQKWTPSTAPLFGHPVAAQVLKSGAAYLVFRFENQFEVPSEVYRLEPSATTKITSLFKQKDRLVTDVRVLPDGAVLLAAVEPPGAAPGVPIPGKIKMLAAADGKTFAEVKVDYRATARRVFFSSFGGSLWAFTDTGMLLHLE